MDGLIAEWHLRYPGISDVELVYFYAVSTVSDEKRRSYLQKAYSLGQQF